MGGAPWGGTPGVPQARPGASFTHRMRAPPQLWFYSAVCFRSPLSRRERAFSVPSPVTGPSRGNDFQRHRIFLLLHRTSGGCAQDSPRIHPAVMPHPARGAGHPQRAVNHPAGGPRRRPFLWIDAWTPPQPEFETTQCTPWSHPWGSYPRSSNTKPRSAPAWAVSRQTSFRRPAKILSSGKLFCYSPGRRPPLEPEAAPLRWGAPPGEERQACPRHVQALPLHIACGRPPSCGFTVQFASALRFPGANGRFQFRHRSPAPPGEMISSGTGSSCFCTEPQAAVHRIPLAFTLR